MTSTTVAPTDAPALVRAWGRTLGVHAAALSLLLLALMPLLGTSRMFSADEGAAHSQAHLLAEGKGWFLDHPRPDLDPTGENFLIHLSSIEGDRGAPFAKHPVYAVALTPLEAVGGKPAMVLTSLVGTVAAALAAALLARRIRPGIDRATFWAVGLASPAFLYSYVLIAHTLGAALATLAVYLAVRGRRGWGDLVGITLLLVLAVTLRSEAILFGLAMGAACTAVAWLQRDRRLLLAGVAAGAGAVLGNFVDRFLAGLVASGGMLNPTAGSSDFLNDRIFAAVITWLLPSYDGLGLDDALLVGAALFGVMAVVVARKHPEDGPGIRLFAGLATACAVGRLLLPANPVSGLLVAFPLFTAGLASLSRDRLRNPAAAVATATFALFSLAVLATQYRAGGSGEWGGRYFLLGLPVIVPVVMAGLADVGQRVDATTRRALIGAAVVGSLAIAAVSGLALYRKQWGAQHTLDAIEQAMVETPDAVFVATDGTSGRYGWRHVVAGEEWLLALTPAALDGLGERLAEEGRPIVLSTLDEDGWLADLPDYEVVDSREPVAGTSRVVLTLVPR